MSTLRFLLVALLLQMITLLGTSLSFAKNKDSLANLDCTDGQVAIFEQASSSWICGSISSSKTIELYDANDTQVGTYIGQSFVLLSIDGKEFLISAQESEEVGTSGIFFEGLQPLGTPVYFTSADCTGIPYFLRTTFLGLTGAKRYLDPHSPTFEERWVVPTTLYTQKIRSTVHSEAQFDAVGVGFPQCVAKTTTLDLIEGVHLATNPHQLFSSPLRLVISGGTGGN